MNVTESLRAAGPGTDITTSARGEYRMETRRQTADGHTDTLVVTKTDSGWEVREMHDRTVVRAHEYSDWHRVERAIQVFDLGATAYSTNR
jgi:hypothetical protein